MVFIPRTYSSLGVQNLWVFRQLIQLYLNQRWESSLTHLLTYSSQKSPTKSSPFYRLKNLSWVFLLLSFPATLVQVDTASHLYNHNSLLACHLAVMPFLNFLRLCRSDLVLPSMHFFVETLSRFPSASRWKPAICNVLWALHDLLLFVLLASFLNALPSLPCILCLSHTQLLCAFQPIRLSFHDLNMKVVFSSKLPRAFCTAFVSLLCAGSLYLL